MIPLMAVASAAEADPGGPFTISLTCSVTSPHHASVSAEGGLARRQWAGGSDCRQDLPGAEDARQGPLDPADQRYQMGSGLLPERRQFVVDMRRHHRMRGAQDEAIGLKLLQGLGKHPFGNAPHLTA